ncbi:MAG: YqaA family protein [Rhodospirillaceae bacterium]
MSDAPTNPPMDEKPSDSSQTKKGTWPPLQRLYDWTMDRASRKDALWFLAFISFIESSIFPIPPDVLLIPMVLAARTQAWKIAAVCTISSVLGGLAGYAIGALLFDTIGHPLLSFYGHIDKFDQFSAWYEEWGAWIVGGAGITPFPYKFITIASGTFGLDLVVFTVASILSRGARFFFVAWLLWYFGEPIRTFIEKHLGALTILFFALLFGGFLVLKVL